MRKKIDNKIAYKLAVVLVVGLFAVIALALPVVSQGNEYWERILDQNPDPDVTRILPDNDNDVVYIPGGIADYNHPQLEIQIDSSYELRFIGTVGANIHAPDSSMYFLVGKENYDDHIIGFGTDGDNNQMVLKDGKVGIWTESPDKLLHIGVSGGPSGTMRFEASDGDEVDLGITTNDNFYITGGNVGIGTTSPGTELDIKGNVNLNNQYSSTAGYLNPGYYVYKSGTTAYGMKLQYTNGEYGTMIFGPNQANKFIGFGKVGTALEDDEMVEYMRIDLDNGNVGIGTTNPDEKLDLGELGTATSTATQQSSGKIALTGSYWTGSAEAKHRFKLQNIASTTVNEEGRLGILWDSSELVSIKNNGIVGIGTTNPDSDTLLHVVGTNNHAGVFTSDQDSEDTYIIDAHYSGAGTSNNGVAVYGKWDPSGGDIGIGGKFEGGYTGVWGVAQPDPSGTGSYSGVVGQATQGSSGSGTLYGVLGQATGGTTHYAVSGQASGGTTSYGGYFSATGATNNYGLIVENGDVGIGTATPIGALTIDNTGESKGLGVTFDTYYQQTTDATATNIATISTETDKAYGLTVTVIGIQQDGSNAAHYVLYAGFKNDGGSLSGISSITPAHTAEDDVTWGGVTLTTPGTDIIVQVTGKLNTNIEWQATVEMNIVGV